MNDDHPQAVKSRILVVDDEPRILNFLGSRLRASGYHAVTASNGHDAVAEVRRREPDLVLLDVVMPEMDGFQALNKLRSFSGVPVIMLTASAVQGNKLRALSDGADDYVTKPFNPDELVSRIKAILRRMNRRVDPSGNLRFLGDLRINLSSGTVSIKSQPIYLARTEWLILKELAASPGIPVTYERLIGAVWGHPDAATGRRLKNWVSRLRLKIDSTDPKSCIRTLRGSAYVLGLPTPGKHSGGIC